MVSLSEAFFEYICPSLGAVMSSALFSAPLLSLRDALARGSLDDLNPMPWAFMLGNCLGWVAYAYVTKDPYVLLGNLPGLLFSVWLNTGAAKLQYSKCYTKVPDKQNNIQSSLQIDMEKADAKNNSHLQGEGNTENGDDEKKFSEESDTQIESSSLSMEPLDNESKNTTVIKSKIFTQHELWAMGIAIIWAILLSIMPFLPVSYEVITGIIGIAVNINSVAFYGAPLSTVRNVLRTRTSTSIHRRSLIMYLLNSFFWSAYALAVLDFFIFIPNFSGLVLSILQLILCLVFPVKKDDEN